MRRRAAAFTLIELLAALLLAALLAGGISFSLRATLRDAHAQDAAGRLTAFDALARENARRLNRPSELRIDPRSGRIMRRERSSDAGDSVAEAVWDVPAGVSIEQVATVDGRTFGGEAVAVACSARGQTASYAVLLRGPGARRRWVLFAGLSGDARILLDDRDVQDTFEMLAAH